MALTVVQPGVGGTGNANLTFPNVTGTVMVSGNMPAFSVVPNTTQSISTSTETKVAFQTENFDTANCFDNVTNYRFTPNVAGYYQFNFGVRIGGTSLTFAYPMIYKNGSRTRVGNQFTSSSGLNAGNILVGSDILYMNGTTDYVELYCLINGTSPAFNYNDSGTSSYFSGSLIRTA